MTRPLSDDLRQRVIEAVEGGLSRRAAAERFDVSPSSAIRWMQRWRESASRAPKRFGGDRRSHRIDAFRDEILALVEATPDLKLTEIAGHLEQAHGERIAPSTVWRFFERHGVTYKKDGARQRTGSRRHKGSARSLVRGAAGPRSGAPRLHRRSSARQHALDGPAPRWRACAAAARRANAAGPRSRTGTRRPPPLSERYGSRA